MADSNLLARIPHRPPFLWVDAILSETENRIETEKYISHELPLFAGHYPDYPLLPGVILCEAAFQTGALLLSKNKDRQAAEIVKIPVVTRILKAKFKREVHPGDTIKVQVKLLEKVGPAWFLQGKVLVREKVALSLEFACAFK